MKLRHMLFLMCQLLLNSKSLPARQRQVVHENAKKMYGIYTLLKKRRQKGIERKFWVRPIFREDRRLLQGASENLVLEMRSLDTEKYFNYFRMTPEIFDELLSIVGPRIQKKRVFRNPISSRLRLELTLRWLSSGESMTSISYAFRVAHNTVSKIVSETCEEIWEALKDKVFLQPSERNWQKVAEDFEVLWNFPNCIGAIDGKHVVIQAPPNSGSAYYNYKGSHSINLLAISDAKCCFTIVDIGSEGRQSDEGVFATSGLANLLETNALHVPEATTLKDADVLFPFMVVADEAFPLKTYMMSPYPRSRNLDLKKKVFNYRLSRARRVVESAFGILVARWRIFRRPIIASTSTTRKAVQATTALHNFIMKHELELMPQRRLYSTLNAQERTLVSTGLVNTTNRSRSARMNAAKVKDAYATYFEVTNPLPWQWEKALSNDF